MRRVIFLDVDGVLNSHESFESRRATMEHPLDAQLVARFRWLADKSGADVVLSSTWRLIDVNRELLSAVGISWVGMTPDRWPSQPRGQEIRSWLADNGGADRIVILDDDADAEIGTGLFIRTDEKVGLTLADVKAALTYLRYGRRL